MERGIRRLNSAIVIKKNVAGVKWKGEEGQIETQMDISEKKK